MSEFSEELQPKLLSLIFTDKDFLLTNLSFIKPYYFSSTVDVDLCRIAVSFGYKYKSLIQQEELISEIKNLYFENRPPLDEYLKKVEEIYSQPIGTYQYIKDKFKEFVLYEEYKKGLSESIDLLKKGELDKIKALWGKLIKTEIDKSDGTNYFDYSKIMERLTETDTSIRIPTGLPDLDEALQGGLAQGELGIIIGGTNVGKSIFLTIFGANALKNRKKVVHFSFEMREKKIALRYDRNLLGKSLMILRQQAEESAKKLIRLKEMLQMNLYIKEYPARRGGTVYDILSEVDYLKSNLFFPDILIIDYASIMKAVQPREQRYLEIEETVELLYGCSAELNVPIWTAGQLRQNALNKKTPTIEDLGEAFGQAKIADVVLILAQDEAEYKQGIIRIVLAKNRDNKKLQTFTYFIDYDTMSISK